MEKWHQAGHGLSLHAGEVGVGGWVGFWMGLVPASPRVGVDSWETAPKSPSPVPDLLGVTLWPQEVERDSKGEDQPC